MRSRRSSIGLSLVAAALVAAAAAPLSCSKTAAKGAGIACQTQADCVDGDYPICDFVLRVCVAGDGGVPSDSGVGSVVDMAAMCSTSAMCKPTLPECTAGACSPCSDAGDGGVSAVCGTFFKDTPLCAAGRCVECIAAADCAAKNKACKSNRCDACATHADCTSGICDDGGKCVAADQILHVDNRGMKVADCKTNFPGADGTTAMSAWCDIADALPPRRPWILVAGSKEVYSPLSFGATVTVGLVGPGRGAATRAIIFNGNGPAISIFTPAAKNVDLLVDGFEVRSLSGDTPPLDAISCSSQTNGSKLRVRNTLVHNSSGYGVAASRCDLTLDGNDIRLNSGGGVSVATGPYSITNNFIVQNNGGKSFGVQFGSSVMGKFAFMAVNDRLMNECVKIKGKGDSSFEVGKIVIREAYDDECARIEVDGGKKPTWEAKPGSQQNPAWVRAG